MPGVGTSWSWQDGESANIDYFVHLCYGFSIVKVGDALSLSLSVTTVALCLEYFEHRRCNPKFSHLQVKVSSIFGKMGL